MANKPIDMASVSKLVRQREPPITVQEAASKLNIAQSTYSTARDIIYLLDEEGLDEDEVGVVIEAFRLISAGYVSQAREMVAPVMFVRFGDTKISGSNSRIVGGPITVRERQREQFETTLITLVDHVTMADQVFVPFIDNDSRKRLCDDIDRATRALNQLKRTITQGGTNAKPGYAKGRPSGQVADNKEPLSEMGRVTAATEPEGCQENR